MNIIDNILWALELFYHERGHVAKIHAKRRFVELAPLLSKMTDIWWGSTANPMLMFTLEHHDTELLSRLRPLLGGRFNPAQMMTNLMDPSNPYSGISQFYTPRENLYASLVSHHMRPYLQAYINMRS